MVYICAFLHSFLVHPLVVALQGNVSWHGATARSTASLHGGSQQRAPCAPKAYIVCPGGRVSAESGRHSRPEPNFLVRREPWAKSSLRFRYLPRLRGGTLEGRRVACNLSEQVGNFCLGVFVCGSACLKVSSRHKWAQNPPGAAADGFGTPPPLSRPARCSLFVQAS